MDIHTADLIQNVQTHLEVTDVDVRLDTNQAVESIAEVWNWKPNKDLNANYRFLVSDEVIHL